MTNSLSRYVVYAEADKCKACKKCELACIASHNNISIKEAVKKRNMFASRVHVIKTDSVKMPVQCRQCTDAPCARVCPTDALVQENGSVVMRQQYCAACQLCVMACPYGAIELSFIGLPEADEADPARPVQPRRGVAVRCDVCADWRVREGKENGACVEACPVKALRMVTLEEYRALRG